jgi:hypothetical protein
VQRVGDETSQLAKLVDAVQLFKMAGPRELERQDARRNGAVKTITFTFDGRSDAGVMWQANRSSLDVLQMQEGSIKSGLFPSAGRAVVIGKAGSGTGACCRGAKRRSGRLA